jgi:hypothetical protein
LQNFLLARDPARTLVHRERNRFLKKFLDDLAILIQAKPADLTVALLY